MEPTGLEVAIVGMQVRMPHAPNLDAFWQLLVEGDEAFTTFTEAEMAADGLDEVLFTNPAYVPVRGALEPDDYERFDAGFFGMSRREAELIDPQQRIMLECAWHALEAASCDPTRYAGSIGVYASANRSSYVWSQIASRPDIVAQVGQFQIGLCNQSDYLPTRISYKLNLKGPSINVQTACSSSLVAVHMACQGLLAGECDVALAGGVGVAFPHHAGHLYEAGSILSPDGHCRVFDQQAAGTMGGCGAGIVALKRLDDAQRDGNVIHAVIKGSAVNNDGALKAGFTTPSIDGQVKVIQTAQQVAEVAPGTVSLLEAHGTGTVIGDPIEVAALTRAFREGTDAREYCALGAVKANIGHLGSAAGIAGLIKTVLALEHATIPPHPTFSAPNPALNLAESPFYVPVEARPWDPEGGLRRAGVSSFGLGGTNAHVVLEQAPARAAVTPASRPDVVLRLSATTGAALNAQAEQLAAACDTDTLALPDIAYTLATGRQSFAHRGVVTVPAASTGHDVATALRTGLRTAVYDGAAAHVTFLCPGQGSQYAGMSSAAYEAEPIYRHHLDEAAAVLQALMGEDLRKLLLRPSLRDHDARADTGRRLHQTAYLQPILFATQYAMGQWWKAHGVHPHAFIGHSVGEFAAACLSGVFSLESALKLVALRGQLMQALPSGAMISVLLEEADVLPMLPRSVSVAAINGPGRCVISGEHESMDALARQFDQDGIDYRRLNTSHAFHSPMMDPMLDEFERAVASVEMRPPEVPFVSCVTGTWITASEATSPAYWARHARAPVRFMDGVSTLLAHTPTTLVEIGPGRTLTSLAAKHPNGDAVRAAVNSAYKGADSADASSALLEAAGGLWQVGVDLSWETYYAEESRRYEPVPQYPFQRKRYWIERDADKAAAAAEEQAEHEDTTDADAPVTEVQRGVAEIWTQLLGARRIRLHDRFLELGGDSLVATRVLARLTERFGVRVPMAALIGEATVASIASELEALMAEEAPAVTAVVEHMPERQVGPLSFAQQRLWAIDQFNPGDPAYIMQVVVALVGPLERTALAAALSEVTRRHATLRTTFHTSQDGEPEQRIAAPTPFALPLVDLTGVPSHVRERVVQRLASEDARRPFALSRGPLIRAQLCKTEIDSPSGTERHVLSLCMHHIISDGWSIRIMMAEMQSLYDAFLRGAPSPLPPLSVQYVDTAASQRQRFRQGELDDLVGEWQAELAGASFTETIPVDHERRQDSSGSGASVSIDVPPELVSRLRARAQEVGGTLFMVLATAVHVLVHSYTRSTDIVIGTDSAGRNSVEEEELIGFFINQLALRLSLDGNPTLRALLDRARVGALSAFAKREAPFDRVVAAVAPQRDPRFAPLFQVKLTLQNTPVVAPATTQDTASPGLVIESIPVEKQASRHDLFFNVHESAAGLVGDLEYAAGLYRKQTILDLVQDWKTVMEALAADVEAPLDSVVATVREAAARRSQARARKQATVDSSLLSRARRRSVSTTGAV
ncbi:MAG: condensation domain-containing protein [Bacteroidota bacterium]